MVNLRRLPGVLYQYRLQVIIFVLVSALSIFFLLQTGIVCTNHKVETALQQLCEEYEWGRAVGSLCKPLCKDDAISSISCTPLHSGKHLVFSARWLNQMIMIKSAYPASYKQNGSHAWPTGSEEDFKKMVAETVSNKLNISVSLQQLERLQRLDPRKELATGSALRLQEQRDIYTLLQSQEYLLSVLFADRDLFPQILGTCGHLYAVEFLQEPQLNSFAFSADDQEVWSEKMKLAILIMDLLAELETNFPDPLHLCDIKMSHFGLTTIGRLKYLDLDLVYTDNALQQMLSKGQLCTNDPECDLFDCKASCNPDTKKCDSGLINNNLQSICEKIFIGWTLSGKMILPGLLMTEHTPAPLASLLRQCAENGRSAVPEDLKERLYTTLTEMDQILTEKLHP